MKLYLGAINIETGKYENPNFADKKNKYKCCECNKSLILRKGKILRPHFAHYKSKNPCNYFNKPTESEIHKSGKYLIKSIIENKKNISIHKKCTCCNDIDVNKIPIYNDEHNCIIEYGFKYRGDQKYADVALINKNTDEIIFIFEIYYKHRTDENNRPEPWCEINAIDLLNTNCENNDVIIKCERDFTCDKCEEKRRQKTSLSVDPDCDMCWGTGRMYLSDGCSCSCECTGSEWASDICDDM